VDGRKDVVQAALREAGMADDIFESLHLEGPASRLIVKNKVEKARAGSGELARDLLSAALETLGGTEGEDSVPWIGEDGPHRRQPEVQVRLRVHPRAAHPRVLRERVQQPEQALVVRVAEPDGSVIYENAATPDGAFEVKREMEGPSFKGLKLFLRYRDASIEQDVNRWKTWTLCLIGFIDLMLGAGLYLIYSNVRRELHLSRLKSDFVANVSHELKTPLALIRLFAETLEMGRVPGARRRKVPCRARKVDRAAEQDASRPAARASKKPVVVVKKREVVLPPTPVSINKESQRPLPPRRIKKHPRFSPPIEAEGGPSAKVPHYRRPPRTCRASSTEVVLVARPTASQSKQLGCTFRGPRWSWACAALHVGVGRRVRFGACLLAVGGGATPPTQQFRTGAARYSFSRVHACGPRARHPFSAVSELLRSCS
jgi:hypothetical protein